MLNSISSLSTGSVLDRKQLPLPLLQQFLTLVTSVLRQLDRRVESELLRASMQLCVIHTLYVNTTEPISSHTASATALPNTGVSAASISSMSSVSAAPDSIVHATAHVTPDARDVSSTAQPMTGVIDAPTDTSASQHVTREHLPHNPHEALLMAVHCQLIADGLISAALIERSGLASAASRWRMPPGWRDSSFAYTLKYAIPLVADGGAPASDQHVVPSSPQMQLLLRAVPVGPFLVLHVKLTDAVGGSIDHVIGAQRVLQLRLNTADYIDAELLTRGLKQLSAAVTSDDTAASNPTTASSAAGAGAGAPLTLYSLPLSVLNTVNVILSSFHGLASLVSLFRNTITKRLLAPLCARPSPALSGGQASPHPSLLQDLPTEVTMTVWSFLDARELASVSQTSYACWMTTGADFLWRSLCLRDFGVSDTQKATWRSEYTARRYGHAASRDSGHVSYLRVDLNHVRVLV